MTEERLPLCVPDSDCASIRSPSPPTRPLCQPLDIKKPRRGSVQEEKRRVYFGSVSSGSSDAEWVSFSQTTKTTVTISKASGRKKPAADA